MPLVGIVPGLLVVAGLIELKTPAFAQRLIEAVMTRIERLQPA
jgi:hypothetical protein